MIDIFVSHFFSIILAYTFGSFFIHFLFSSKNKIDIYENILLGYIFFGFSVLVINFLSPISYKINSIILIISIILIFIFKKKNLLQLLKIISISSIFVFILISYSKINDPDGFLYHMPFTQILNEQKIIFGISNLHFRFGTISLQQYIDAGNLNLLNKSGLIVSSASIFSIIFLKLIINIYKYLTKKNYLSSSFFIFYLFLIFILSIRFNRYSDYGNDAITSFFLIYLLILIFQKNFSNFTKEEYFKISIISLAIFTFKPFYFLLLLLPFFILFLNKKVKIFTKINLFLLIFLSVWITKNIFISGCALYPIEKTCIKELSWFQKDKSNSYYVKNISISGEAYAKSWNTQKKLSQTEYIKNFNWFSNWKKNHFDVVINKTQYAFYFFLIVLLVSLRKNKNRFFKDLKINLINLIYKNYIFCFVIFGYLIIWFLKFPILRYSYVIIFMVFFFPYLHFLFSKIIIKKIRNFCSIFISICILFKKCSENLSYRYFRYNSKYRKYFLNRKQNYQ